MDNNNDLLYWKLGQMNAAKGYAAAAKGKGTSGGPDAAPTGLTLTVLSDTSIKLDWTDASSNEEGFRIYSSTDGSTFTEVDTVAADTETYNATSLTAGTLYYFYVVAYIGTAEGTATDTESATTWTEGEAVIRAANTVAWYDSTDLTTITKDGSNFVSEWSDKLGSGHDLLQATGTNQLLYSATGILADGIDNYMMTNTFTLTQPAFIYLVARHITYNDYDYFFDGFNPDSCIMYHGILKPSPSILAYAGIISTVNTELALNNFAIIRVLFNGANSLLQINDTAATTGNFGPNHMAGFTLASKSGGVPECAGNHQYKEIIIRDSADDAANQKKIYNYLATKYGFTTI